MASPAKKQRKEFVCDVCGKGFGRKQELDRHTDKHAQNPKFWCPICHKSLESNTKLLRHNASVHYVAPPRGKGFIRCSPMKLADHQKLPAEDPDDFNLCKDVEDLLFVEAEHVAETYVDNWDLIKTEYVDCKSSDRRVYNLRLPNSDIELKEFIQRIHHNQRKAYTINLELGFITMDVTTAELHYFWPGWSSHVFDDDTPIVDEKDLQNFLDKLEEHDLEGWAALRRPNTKTFLQMITNVNVVIKPFTDVAVKGFTGKLPSYIKNKKCLIALDTNGCGVAYSDGYCFMRSLALFKAKATKMTAAIEKQAKQFAKMWTDYRNIAESDFQGVEVSELHHAEELFGVKIWVYNYHPLIDKSYADESDEEMEHEDEELFTTTEKEIGEDEEKRLNEIAIEQGEFVAELVRRPENATNPGEQMFLNIYEEDDSAHFSLIIDFEQYSNCYQCPVCGRLDSTFTGNARHTGICDNKKQKHVFVGGGFRLKKTVFEMLDEEDDPQLQVSEELKYYPYKACYDFESYSQSLNAHVFESLKTANVVELPPEDPVDPEDGTFVRHWDHIRTNYSAVKGHYVVRCDKIDWVSGFVDAIAQQQETQFCLGVALLVHRPKHAELVRIRLLDNPPPVVFNRMSLELALELLEADVIAEKVKTGDKMLGLEIGVRRKKQNFVQQLHIASCAIATDIPGHQDPATGFPSAHFIVSDGNSSKMIKKFLDHLNSLSVEAEKNLRPLYKTVLDRLQFRISLHAANIKKVLDPLLKRRNVIPRGSSFYKQLEYCKGALSGDEVAALRYEREQLNRMTTILQMLQDWLSHLPVLGFNSSSFDLNLIRRELLPLLVKERDETGDKSSLSLLRKDGSTRYLQIKSPRLIFLDQLNFLAQGCSYDQFLRAYKVPEELLKSFFPYDYFTSLSILKLRELPPREAFYNDLKGEELSQENYDFVRRIWRNNRMETFLDYLKWYNSLDVKGFVIACNTMAQFFREKRKLDLYKGGFMSTPGLALKDMMNHADPFTHLVTEQKVKNGIDNSDVHDLIRAERYFLDGIVGGPSLVWKRYMKVGESIIREKFGGTNVCREIMGFDLNSLYLDCIMKLLPVGIGRRWRPSSRHPGRFACKDMYPYSRSELEWLSWVEYEYNKTHDDKIEILHRFNNQRQELVAGYRVDGVSRKHKRIWQYNGCRFHSCMNPDCKINFVGTMEEAEKRRAMDTHIKRRLEAAGYTVTTMRCCDWKQMKRANAELREFLNENFELPHRNTKAATQENLLKRIQDGKLFGIALVDIETPEHLKKEFSEMCPIFKNTSIRRDQTGPVMKQYCEKNGYMKTERRCLVSSYFGKSILLATPLLQWYLNKELKVTKIHEIIEYKGRAVFNKFGEEILDARRAADVGDDIAKVIGELMKLLGNACYGKTLTRVDRHKKVVLCTKKKANKHRKSGRCSVADPISGDLVECSLLKRSIVHQLPTIVGLMVYQYAKLKMLQLYYDCIKRFVKPCDFELLFMDTDSMYMALAKEDFESCVRDDMKEEWEKERYNFFPDPKLGAWGSRVGGLAKVEFKRGLECIALNAKTYFIQGQVKNKWSSKGLPHRNKLTKDQYLSVLQTKEPVSGIVKSFKRMARGGPLARVDTVKYGLSFCYVKRRVLDDNISTEAYDDI